MRGKHLWGTVLATWTILIPGLAFGQSPVSDAGGLPFGQSGENYSPPDSVVPIPLFSTHPEAGGLFVATDFWMERQTNPIGNQIVAVRGFYATNADVLGAVGTEGTFLGSGKVALTTKTVSGPESYEPGYAAEIGWKFADGSALTFTFRQLIEASYSGGVAQAPVNQVGANDINTFVSSNVYNFPAAFNGPTFKVVSGPFQTNAGVPVLSFPLGESTILVSPGNAGQDVPNGAAGIWNGATQMELSFIQRFTDYFFTYRFPVIDTENYRVNGLMGPRATWLWEEFKWRTVDLDVLGNSDPTNVALYTNIASNYMYGAFIGCEQEYYLGHGFAAMLDTRVTAYLDVVEERAKYQLGDYEIVANKRDIKQYSVVPEVEGTLSLMWYPWEGVEVKLGYNGMAFINTIASPDPISFNYTGLNPTYEHMVRLFDGFQAGVSFSF